MIPNAWYAVLESRKVTESPVGIKRLGENLVLWRDKSHAVSCLPDRCPHRGAKLSLGRVCDGKIECPYHGFVFDRNGECKFVPANGPDYAIPPTLNIRSWPTRDQFGLIWVWYGEPREVYPPVPWFRQSLKDEHNSAEKSGAWNFHYARVIENNLDAHHFPFIHGSISPNVGTLIDPFEARQEGDVIHVSAGLKRVKTDPDSDAIFFHMKFRFPNVIWVHLHDKIKLQQIATPIDDNSTWMYGRYYQGFVKAPIVGPVVSRLIMEGDWWIAQEFQDFPVFYTQTPKVPGHRLDYKYIEADKGIAMFYRERERRILAAAQEQNAEKPDIDGLTQIKGKAVKAAPSMSKDPKTPPPRSSLHS